MTEKRTSERIPIFDVRKWTVRMLIAAAFGAAVLTLADPGQRPYLLGPGIALALCGCAVRLWGTGHLHKNKILATGGPYAFVRHPLYVGTFLVILGLGLMSGQDIALYALLPVALLVFFIYYAPKKERVESDRLRRRFGDDFDRYQAAVWGYVPKPFPYEHRQGRFAWAGVRENREYFITLAVVFGIAVILAKFWL